MNEETIQMMDTVSISCDALILPPTKGVDVNLKEIHAPDFKVGSKVMLQVDGMDEVQCVAKRMKAIDDASVMLAIPHQLFPDFDAQLTDDLIKEGHTIHASVKIIEAPDHKDQLMIDFLLEGKTERPATDADFTS
tara:strand:+ start:6098 stop:6502 length:405 start_codon:yes stop_codon:yes gene_type:complete